MDTGRQYVRLIQGILAAVAATFGLATVVVGMRVVAGSDPGYVVFRPLLFYNIAMGVAYLAAGFVIWRSLKKGKFAAAIIFVLNLLVLGGIVYLYVNGHAVAIDSIRAMTFRTAVWLGFFIGVAWLGRRIQTPGT